jgi:Ca2+:H+ antiporter
MESRRCWEIAFSRRANINDKMDLAIGVAVGSSMQVALLIIPLTVVLGWGLGKDTMDLSFDGFQVAVLFVSVLLVNYLISDGKSSKHFLNVFSLRT